MSNPPVVAVDLFCGVGGLSYGLKESGVLIKAGVDIDPACRWPFEKNIGAAFHEKSVREISGSDVQEMWGKGGAYHLLAGCAPCQPFSSQRRGADTSNEENWDLLREFGRLVRESEPDFVTMENVTRLKESSVFREFLSALVEEDFCVDYEVLLGTDYGLPQRRKRLVLVASRHGKIAVPSPQPHSAQDVSVERFIGELPALQSGEKDPDDPLHRARALSDLNIARLRASKPGGTWRDWPEALRAPCHKRSTGSTFASFYGRMDACQPAPTITTQFFNYGCGRFGHPSQLRSITPREAALLQGFPREYHFIPPNGKLNFSSIGKLIGNAVPPPFGAAVGAAITKNAATISSLTDAIVPNIQEDK